MHQQELCKKLHAAIDKIDDERYDAEAKVQKTDKEVIFLWEHNRIRVASKK